MTTAVMRAITATNDSVSIAPYPIGFAWLSFSSSFGVVPDAMSEWNPDRAPHAIVMNRNGNNEPANTGPSPRSAKSETAGASTCGRASTMPDGEQDDRPDFMKVDR